MAFAAQMIRTTAEGAVHVSAADVDGDGVVDVLSADSDEFAIYINDGWQSFAYRNIGTATGAKQIQAVDVDGACLCENQRFEDG